MLNLNKIIHNYVCSSSFSTVRNDQFWHWLKRQTFHKNPNENYSCRFLSQQKNFDLNKNKKWTHAPTAGLMKMYHLPEQKNGVPLDPK